MRAARTCVLLFLAFAAQVAEGQAGTPPVKLDPVRVTETVPGRVLVGRDAFEERRLLGFGHFFDSTALRKVAAPRLADLLQGEQGLTVVKPPMCTGYVRPELRGSRHKNNCASSSQARVAVSKGLCGMKVMLDGSPVGPGGVIDTEDERFDPRHNWLVAFDLSSIEIGSLGQLEVYRRSEDVPLEYKNHDTECGLLLLWSRR